MFNLREKFFGTNKGINLRERLSDFISSPLSNTASYVANRDQESPQSGKKPTQPTAQNQDTGRFDRLREAIAYNETRSIPEDERYSFRKHSGSKALGDDMGRYQITEGELSSYGDDIMGRVISPDEFINNPQLQDEYMNKKIEYILGDAPDATDEEIFALHRDGLSGRANADIRKQKVERRRGYVDSALKNFQNQPQVPMKEPVSSPLNDREEVLTSADNSLSSKVNKAIDEVKKLVPFAETNFEKGMKKEVNNSFLWTEEAKKVIDGMEIKDNTDKVYSPFVKTKKIDSNLAGGSTASASYSPFRGQKTFDFYNRFSDEINKLPDDVLKGVVGENIKLRTLATNTLGHEFLHSMFQRSNLKADDYYQDFRKELNKNAAIGENKVPLKYIIEHVDQKYPNDSFESKINELFAYVGENTGKEGIDAIPENLQKYYTHIFKKRSSEN